MEKKRYPICMWEKLTRLVNASKAIPAEHKEMFIEIVGSKVANYRNQGLHRRYKAPKLPKQLYIMHENIEHDDYNTIMYWDDLRLSMMLDDIYNLMGQKWFHTS